MKHPKISIVTINFNNGHGLSQTIRSVADQEYSNIQHIVIDGNSTDDSVAEIKKNEEALAYWVSEPDDGIYSAMNKGLAEAQGEYVLFLNSGDYLFSSTIISEIFSEKRTSEILYGYLYTQKDGKLHLKKYQDSVTMELLLSTSLPHPATFYKLNLFERVGLYREDLDIVADWAFNLKAIALYKASSDCLKMAISVFDMEGISSQAQYMAKKTEEGRKVLFEYFGEEMANFISKSRAQNKELSKIQSSKFYKLYKLFYK